MRIHDALIGVMITGLAALVVVLLATTSSDEPAVGRHVLSTGAHWPPDAPCRPSFMIIGAPKCGTTSMYEYLARHPSVRAPSVKEP